MIASGVVRGWPLFRPRTVRSPLKPSGRPAANSGLVIGVKNVIHRGALVAPLAWLLMCARSFLRRFGLRPTQETRKKART
jgi:hypothetical protein